jgi:hypothetical protein
MTFWIFDTSTESILSTAEGLTTGFRFWIENQSAHMQNQIFRFALCATLFALCFSAHAQGVPNKASKEVGTTDVFPG